MAGIDVRLDTRDMDGFVQQGMSEVMASETAVSEAALMMMRAEADYTDVSGTLRNSYSKDVTPLGVRFGNEAPYASDVEARGHRVLSDFETEVGVMFLTAFSR